MNEIPQELLDAMQNNDTQRAIELARGIDNISLLTRGFDNWDVLHYATRSGHIEVMRYCLDNGVNVDTVDRIEYTPLHIAAEYGNLEVLKFLIENGANVEATDQIGRTPLHIAAEYSNLEVLKFLIENGANVEVPNKYSVLFCAIRAHSYEVVRYLLQEGIVDVNAKKIPVDRQNLNGPYQTPIEFCACYRPDDLDKFKTLQELIIQGANINFSNNDFTSRFTYQVDHILGFHYDQPAGDHLEIISVLSNIIHALVECPTTSLNTRRNEFLDLLDTRIEYFKYNITKKT